MSRQNLYKSNWVVLKDDDKRVIDSNDLVAKRIEKLEAQRQKQAEFSDAEGFSPGLDAEAVDALFGSANPEDTAYDDEGRLTDNNVMHMSSPQAAYDGPGPEELLAEAQEEIEQMRAAAMEEVESIKKEVYAQASKEGQKAGYETGQRNGYEAGYHEAMAILEAKERELAEKEVALEERYQEKFKELEPAFIETLTDIYEHIFAVDLSEKRTLIIHLISNTLQKIEGSRNYIVHVSKEDYPYVSMQKQEIVENAVLGSAAMELVEDTTLSKNQCIIETESGIFDCSLGEQLKELTKELKLICYAGKEV